MSYINMGALPSPVDLRDYRIAPSASREYPESFKLPETPVKNQGAVGSCVAHALTSIMEYHYKREHTQFDTLSPGFIYGYRKGMDYKGTGLFLRDALKTAQKIGNLKWDEFPYNVEVPKIIEMAEALSTETVSKAYPNRIAAYVRLSTVNEIKNALMDIGPVLICIKWYSDSKYVNDILTPNLQSDYGYHAVYVYGWNKDGWIVQNSWGALSAGDGRCTLPWTQALEESWSITDYLTDDIVEPDKGNKFLKWLLKIFNAIINFFKPKKK